MEKNTTDTISCGKIRRDIIHDLNLPDDDDLSHEILILLKQKHNGSSILKR